MRTVLQNQDALLFRLKSSRDSGFFRKPPNLGWLATLLGLGGGGSVGAGGSWGMLLPGKKFEIWGTAGNALKLSILPSPTLFLYRLKPFTIPSGGPFWLLGGGVRTPRTPLPSPCLRAWPAVNSVKRGKDFVVQTLDKVDSAVSVTLLPGITFLLINGLWFV